MINKKRGINEQLFELYCSRWNKLCDAFMPIIENKKEEEHPASPLFLYVDNEQEWEKADLRVMIFGQETNKWAEKDIPNWEYNKDVLDNISIAMGRYREVFWNGKWRDEKRKAFWMGLRTLEEKLKSNCKEKNIKIIWNNIIKIGKRGKGKPPDSIYKVEKEHFSVVYDELKIIQPNLMIFFTGPNYDDKIADKCCNFDLRNLKNEREFAKFKIEDIQSFRTYHPRFLLRAKKLWGKDFIDIIVNEIKKTQCNVTK